VTGLAQPGPLGLAFIGLQAVTVLVFAALEYAGLRASLPARPAGAVRT
jgi:hypothetical protein